MNTRRIVCKSWRSLPPGLARLPHWLVAVMLVALAAAVPTLAVAADEDDPPGRVGRLAQVDGEVLWYDSENGAWEAAERNRPLTGGDRLSTGPGSRAELRVGSTVLRLAAASELEVRALDDERMVFELHSGSLALRVRTRELAAEIELLTEEARLAPQRAGHYRLDRIDDSTQAGSWRGELRVLGAGGFDINTGEHVELWREGPGEGLERRLAHTRTPLPQDGFAAWALRADQEDTRTASSEFVSPEMTGVEELDRHGRWDRHPEHGPIWFPQVVAADWAPYRHGRWLWTVRWGWTWVDAAPWGFAPFHYGRWLHFGGRWGWTPGSYVHRPVFAPALVAWVGGPNFGISVNIGGGRSAYPHVGWVPLAPREVYRPWYRASPGHVDRIDRHHRPRPGEPGRPTIPERVHQNPQHWVNQRAPGGVTVVPRDALFRRDPVQRVVVDGPEGNGRPWPAREALPQQAPPVRDRVRERVRERPSLSPQAQPLPSQMGPQRPGFTAQTDRGAREERRDGRAARDMADRREGRADGEERSRPRPERESGPWRNARPDAEASPARVPRPDFGNRPAENQAEREAPVQRPQRPDRPERSVERQIERQPDRRIERQTERRAERLFERANVRPADPSFERPNPRQADRHVERATVQRPVPMRQAPTVVRPAVVPAAAVQAAPPRAIAQPQRPPPPMRAPMPQRPPAAAPRPAEKAEAPRAGPPSRERAGHIQRARD